MQGAGATPGSGAAQRPRPVRQGAPVRRFRLRHAHPPTPDPRRPQGVAAPFDDLAGSLRAVGPATGSLPVSGTVQQDRECGQGTESSGEADRNALGILRQRRGIYLLPNLLTTGCLFSGFYSIVMSMNERFEQAAIALFVAMVLDSLDGRVARMTNTQSAFGEQYDSLADMVSFGAAPAVLAYAWSLKGMGKLGWLGAFIYVAAAALRLARFNTNVGVVSKRYFQGLPSPSAAALVAGLVWVCTDMLDSGYIQSTGAQLEWLAFPVTVYAGVTMVSNVPFFSFKEFNLKRRLPFIAAIVLVLGFVLVSSNPPLVLFCLFVVYGLSGYLMHGWQWLRKRRRTA